MSRLLIVLCLSLLVAGCGFKPRASLAVASSLGPVAVSTVDPYSPLGQGLSVALTRAGATPAVDGQPAAQLRVLSESLGTRPLALDRLAQVREYETTYRVRFDLVGADGAVRVPAQDVELSREYTYDSVASAGSPAEQELLKREMQAEMIQAILRRTNLVLQQNPVR